MEQITLRLAEDTIKSLDEEADERGVSRSELIRDRLNSHENVDELRAEHEEELEQLREEHERELAELRSEVEDLENKRSELQNQLASAHTRIDTTNELVATVEKTRSIEEKKAEAGLLTYAKYRLFGMNLDDD